MSEKPEKPVRPDWKNARPNPYAGKLVHGDEWRRLDKDLAAQYPTSDEVNNALRFVLALRKAGATLPELAKAKRARRAA